MSKNVGIITLFHDNYNYGAALQAYALQKAIEITGNTATVIDYERKVQQLDAQTVRSKSLKEKVRLESMGDFVNLVGYLFRSNFAAKQGGGIQKRRNAFKRFYSDKMKVSHQYQSSSIDEVNEIFDAFVCGSDQVWRPGSFDPNYFLAFANEKKIRFSYAASLGVTSLSDKAQDAIIPLINSLGAVSVRENEAKALLKKYTNRDIDVCVDPTLLHSRAFWEACSAHHHDEPKSKYILSYLIGENNYNRDIAKILAKRLDSPLVAIPGVSRLLQYDFMYAGSNIIDVGPDEFIGLIQNAEAVITDSFHACVFSIIFGKRFFVLERFKRSDTSSMNGRIYDLLKLFDLYEQLITSKKQAQIVDIDASCTPDMTIYNDQLDMSWQFLRNALIEGV